MAKEYYLIFRIKTIGSVDSVCAHIYEYTQKF